MADTSTISRKQVATKKLPKRRLSLGFVKPLLSAELFAAIGLLVVAAFFMVWRLTNQTRQGVALIELASYGHLLSRPWYSAAVSLNGGYYLLMHALLAISHQLWMLRLGAVGFSLLTVLVTYVTICRWHGYKLSLLATGFVATGFSFLALSRQISPLSSELFAVCWLFAAGSWLIEKPSGWSVLLYGLASSFALYMPGGIWLVLISSIIVIRPLLASWSELSLKQRSLAILPAVTTGPLIFLFIRHYTLTLLKNWLGLAGQPLSHYPLTLFKSAQALAYRDSLSPLSTRLGHDPILPIAISLICFVGFWFYVAHLNKQRYRLIAVLSLVLMLITGLSGLPSVILLPLISIALATGLAYLLRQWYVVFPRNPIARQGAYLIMALVMGLVFFYSLRSYFVAAANDPVVISSYRHKLAS